MDVLGIVACEVYDYQDRGVSFKSELNLVEEITQKDIDDFFGCEDITTVNKEKGNVI